MNHPQNFNYKTEIGNYLQTITVKRLLLNNIINITYEYFPVERKNKSIYFKN